MQPNPEAGKKLEETPNAGAPLTINLTQARKDRAAPLGEIA